jgi:hypothetical protein
MRKIATRVSLGLALLGVNSALKAQTNPSSAQAASGAADTSSAMVVPAPVSVEGYSMDFAPETPRTNYLRGGLNIGAAYDDDVFGSASGSAASDVSYSVAPTISFDLTRSRFHWSLSYSPGFTFYQRYSSLNQSSQNVATQFSYRLSPHVTFNAQEVFSKASGGYAQPCETGTGSLCGALQSPNNSIIAPATDTLNESSKAQLTYQFSPGGMVGVTGNFSQLRYPDQSEVPGLYGSTAAGGSAYYTHRLSGRHYIGGTYQYQKYLSHAGAVQTPFGSATETQSLMLFYTFYLQRALSFSLYGGPQYSNTYGGLFPSLRSWSPGGGGSVNWQGQRTALILSYSRKISDGGGLQGAVSYNGVDASIRRQLTPTLSGTIGADYTVNKILDSIALGDSGGHSVSGTAILQQAFGEHFSVSAGYLRLHQSYDVAALVAAPNRDRVWLTIGYQFQRALGR